MPKTTRHRVGVLVRGVFQILMDHPNGLSAKVVIEKLDDLVPPTPFEDSVYPNNPSVRRRDKIVGYSTVNPVKAGWMKKVRGLWSITEKGIRAFNEYPEPERFAQEADPKYGQLVLGWVVNDDGHPEYWLEEGAKPGHHTDDKLKKISANLIGTHNLIVGQSGSGKSFFLGRLVEEILIKTKSNLIIIDPNGDYRALSKIENQKLWDGAEYNAKEMLGKLPHEKSRKIFKGKWKNIKVKAMGGENSNGNIDQLKVNWSDLSVDVIFEDLNSLERNSIFHCHEYFKSLEEILAAIFFDNSNKLKDQLLLRLFYRENESTTLIDMAKGLLEFIKKNRDERAIRNEIYKFLDIYDYFEKDIYELEEMLNIDTTKENKLERVNKFLKKELFSESLILNYLIRNAKESCEYITDDGANLYFGKVSELIKLKIFDIKIFDVLCNIESKIQVLSGDRVTVIDLPSFPTLFPKNIVITAILDRLWRMAKEEWESAISSNKKKDKRVPKFIVIDEAHNIIPSNARTQAEKVLVEQFRALAAEGRKYGLFLLLCSQRPDKLDRFITSECENYAIMKIRTKSIINQIEKIIGMNTNEEKEILENCQWFGKGSVALFGKWVGKTPLKFYQVTRRTIEGGRNLRDKYWATPYR